MHLFITNIHIRNITFAIIPFEKRDQGAHLVGLYCGYAPVELIRAMDAAPVSLNRPENPVCTLYLRKNKESMRRLRGYTSVPRILI